MAMKIHGIRFENSDWEWIEKHAEPIPDTSPSDIVRKAVREYRATILNKENPGQ